MRKIMLVCFVVSISIVLYGQNIWVPEYSQTSQTNNIITIVPPSGWEYLGSDINNALISGGDIKISCDCLKRSGNCSPFHATGPRGTTSGCAGDCTDCKMTQSIKVNGKDEAILHGGYFNKTLNSRILKNGESAPGVFSELINLPEYQTEFLKFVKGVYGDKPIPKGLVDSDGNMISPDGYSFIGVEIFGRAVAIIVPNAYASAMTGGGRGGSKASCDCTKGECSIKSGNILLASAVWCEGDCKGTCTLTTSSIKFSNKGEQYNVKIPSYSF